jgi:release factor glutamine methyltransferase
MNAVSPTVADAVRAATVSLRDAGVADAAGDARRLVAHAVQISPSRLILVHAEPLAPDAAARLDLAVRARAARCPVAQITGRRAFWGREFLVTGAVLDPRPETETVIVQALTAPFRRMLDLGTGSGAILLSLLAERPDATGLGVDISAGALDVARQNA